MQNNTNKIIAFIALLITALIALSVGVFYKQDDVTSTTTPRAETPSQPVVPREAPVEQPPLPTPALPAPVPPPKPVSSNPTPTPRPKPILVPAIVSNKYKDGTYSTDVEYDSPGGLDAMGVTIGITNDTVSSVSIAVKAGSGKSQSYQRNFAGSIEQYVVGRKIANASVDAVSGASLTSESFNSALVQIRTQAAN
jgi:uncharacterized protein with FMN-binding domain